MPIPLSANDLMIWWISCLAPTSTPIVGPSRIRIFGLRSSHFASTTRCWLPPESCLTCSSALGVRMASSLIHRALTCRMRLPSSRPSSPGQLADDSHDHVPADRVFHEQSLSEAVFGQVADAEAHGLVRRADGTFPAFDQDLACIRWIQPEKSERQLGAPGTDQAGETQDLPGVELKTQRR